MKRLLTISALVALAGGGGCATVESGRGFNEVQQQVHDRLPGGVELRWDRGTGDDAQARAAVERLLSQELTVEAAVQVALLNNRDLQATYEELDLAQADLVRAGLLKNPIFSGEVRFDTDGHGTGIVLDVAQDFVSLLALPLRKARAGAAFEATKARVAAAVVDVAFDTSAAYYEHVASEETAALRAHVEQAAGASLALARRLREAGNTRELDLLSEEALYERARLDAESARADTVRTRERLNVLMGTWGSQTAWRPPARLPDLPSSGDGPDPAAAEIEHRAVASSLALAEARLNVDAAASGLRLAQPLAWLEGTEVGAAAEREVDGGWSVGPSISIPVPIFDAGSAASAEASARLRQAADHYYAAAVRVRAEARASIAALQAARTRAERMRTVILPLHERIVSATQLQYNAMQVSGFQLLQARREQVEAAVTSVQALRDYWTARTGLAQTLGGSGVATGAQKEQMAHEDTHGHEHDDTRTEGAH